MRWAGKYDVVGDLSSGGMGKLSLARSVSSGAFVVVKQAHSREDDERLRDEARVGLRLLHPHIVETLDLIEIDGRPGLVTAYVSGASLFDLRKHGPLAPAVVCRLGRQISEALDAIHNAVDDMGRPLGMLHRDVTASNVMLGHDGKARLIDLGIARSRESRAERTDTGSVRGTLRYLAPELFGDGEHSAQTDLWSLGIVLWEAIRGREALKGATAAAIHTIISGKVMQLEHGEIVDGRMQRALAQLLKVKPDDRPRRARDAAALFAMLEKQMPEVDVDRLSSQAVSAAVGPRSDALGVDPQRLMARAAAVFGEEARMQTTGMANVDITAAEMPVSESSILVMKDVVEPDGPPAALIEETVDESPKTPAEAIMAYARLLQRLERPPQPSKR
ncbi:MAG TPA: serine/threonine-protein kinase [Myxococcota bacterium]|jgi:serine/threonine protein kinase